MAGILYLVGTPIGNLEDMSYRAVRVLKEADLIACEDTRTSLPLLQRYEIRTPQISYHKFNENERGEELVGRLLMGQNIALITDAGMPAVSDPGEVLVRKCMENSITVTAVPGPSACVTALALSGADTSRFAFEGFLPADNSERKKRLSELRTESRTMIIYEAPHRLTKTLSELADAFGGERKVSFCRELTKKFETVLRMTLAEAAEHYGGSDEAEKPRGEFVLVVDGRSGEEAEAERRSRFEQMTVEEHVSLYETQGMDHKSAMKAAAKDRGVSRRDIYQALLKNNS